MKKKIGVCVVIYNPDEKVISNMMSYITLFDDCIVVDNSDNSNNSIISTIKNIKNITYISMGTNSGIAKALNTGLNILCDKSYDYALTMDQDSSFPIEYYTAIYKCIEQYEKEYSIIGLNFNYHNLDKNNEVCEVPYWLTSGNFVNLKDYKLVGGFENDLFIDYVDIEFGYKLFKANKKICYLKNYSLKHKIGNPIEINLGFKKYYSMNHSPIRYYYRYRNSYYLYKKDKLFFKKLFYKEIFINIPKMFIFERGRTKKLKMIFAGICAAKNNQMGKYNEVKNEKN